MGTGSHLQICVIDGDAAVRDSMRTFGEAIDAPVCCFASATEFFTALEKGTVTPACVICAADLPDCDGITVFNRLPDGPVKLPFALVLNTANVLLHTRARACGISHVLRKPLLNQHLLAFLERTGAQT